MGFPIVISERVFNFIGTYLNLLFVCLWLVILFYPLKGINKHDMLCGAVYSLFLVFSGVVLMTAVPGGFLDEIQFSNKILIIFLMLITSFFRWTYGTKKKFEPPKPMALKE